MVTIQASLVTESPWQPATQPRNLGVHSKASASRTPYHFILDRHRKAGGCLFYLQLQELVSPEAKEDFTSENWWGSNLVWSIVELFNYFPISKTD